MGTRFEPDRPPGNPFLQEDPADLSDAVLDQAGRACAAAALKNASPSARRFLTQRGRADAAMAVRFAKDHEASAKGAMYKARALWRKAASEGSSSAMNLLGYYWAGDFDGEVNGDQGSDQCGPRSPSAAGFAFAEHRPELALKYWLQGARAIPPNPNAMTGAGLLLVTATDCPVPASLTERTDEGIQLLKKAYSLGSMNAARILGEQFMIGRGSDLPRNVDEALRWFKKACLGSEPGVKARIKAFLKEPGVRRLLSNDKLPAGC